MHDRVPGLSSIDPVETAAPCLKLSKPTAGNAMSSHRRSWTPQLWCWPLAIWKRLPHENGFFMMIPLVMKWQVFSRIFLMVFFITITNGLEMAMKYHRSLLEHNRVWLLNVFVSWIVPVHSLPRSPVINRIVSMFMGPRVGAQPKSWAFHGHANRICKTTSCTNKMNSKSPDQHKSTMASCKNTKHTHTQPRHTHTQHTHIYHNYHIYTKLIRAQQTVEETSPDYSKPQNTTDVMIEYQWNRLRTSQNHQQTTDAMCNSHIF